MSRHLIIRCDAPACAQQTETRASDTQPTSVDVPVGWLTLRATPRPDQHFCSDTCLYIWLRSFMAQTTLNLGDATNTSAAPSLVNITVRQTGETTEANKPLPPETFPAYAAIAKAERLKTGKRKF